MALKALERLVVDVLIDNSCDSYSSKPKHVSPEFNNVINAGATEISGTTLCCAQLGLSLMMTASCEGEHHKLLFDAGPEGSIFVRNCRTLGVSLNDVEEIAISHGHWDHMGALPAAVEEITRNSQRRVPCHVNRGMFIERGVQLSDGRVVPFEKVPSEEQLSQQGAQVVSSEEPRTLLDNFFYLSGEIPRVTSFEKGRQDHLCRSGEDQPWVPDPFLMDERYLAAELRDKGMIVFSSCSHAGIINVLRDVRAKFPDKPIFGVFGGFHLVGSLEKIIPDTIEGLREFKPQQIVPGHCTGWRAQVAMVNSFGEDIVVPSAVGSRYTF